MRQKKIHLPWKRDLNLGHSKKKMREKKEKRESKKKTKEQKKANKIIKRVAAPTAVGTCDEFFPREQNF